MISEKLKLVVCDPDGEVCLKISEMDRKAIAEVINEIIELENESLEWYAITEKKEDEINLLRKEVAGLKGIVRKDIKTSLEKGQKDVQRIRHGQRGIPIEERKWSHDETTDTV